MERFLLQVAHKVMGGLHVIAISSYNKSAYYQCTSSRYHKHICTYKENGSRSSILNLTKTLLGYIHGISLGPMRLLFIESYRVYK